MSTQARDFSSVILGLPEASEVWTASSDNNGHADDVSSDDLNISERSEHDHWENVGFAGVRVTVQLIRIEFSGGVKDKRALWEQAIILSPM
jgi:hypothetical protein